jgi:hypothetical protein
MNLKMADLAADEITSLRSEVERIPMMESALAHRDATIHSLRLEVKRLKQRAGLPEELVGRLRKRVITLDEYARLGVSVSPDSALLNDVFTWHEQQTGGGNDH